MSVLQPGEVLDGRYEVIRQLGEGAMARVYVVRHAGLESLHALKVLNAEAAQHPDVLRWFLEEGRIQATLKHPHLTAVTEIVTHPVNGLVLEYVNGESLEEWVSKRGPLPPDEAARLFLPVLEAMTVVHRERVIHRDLKPANILLAQDSRGRLVPKVTDFGIAQRLQAGEETLPPGPPVGTPLYMSPEQALGGAMDARSDIFALGAILQFLVTGRHPFDDVGLEATRRRILEDRRLPLPGGSSHVLAPCLRRALATSPADRYANCAEFHRDLEKSAGLSAPEVVAAEDDPRPPRLSLDFLGTGVLGLAAALAGQRALDSVAVRHLGGATLKLASLSLRLAGHPECSLRLALPTLARGSRHQLPVPAEFIPLDLLATLQAPRTVVLEWEVSTEEGKAAGSGQWSLRLHPADTWAGSSAAPEQLCAFICPGDPLARGLAAESTTGMVFARIRQLAERVGGLRLAPVSRVGSIETGLTLRPYDALVESARAHDLERSVLLAAAAESAGLRPVLLVAQRSSSVLAWVSDESFRSGLVEDPEPLRAALARRALVPSGGPGPDLDAQLEEGDFCFALDVLALRSQVRPRVPGAPLVDPTAPNTAPAQPLGARELRRFERWEDQLLDLTLHNRLLNFRPDAATALPLTVEDLSSFEDQLADGKSFELRAASPKKPAPGTLSVALDEAELWKRERRLAQEERTALEEGGATTLFVGVGWLQWVDKEGQPRLAPLLLYPVTIELDRARKQARFRRSGEDPRPNETLVEKLGREFQLDVSVLEQLEQDEHGVDVPRLLAAVRSAVHEIPGWCVRDEAHLGLFPFTKFLMWKDLREHRDPFLSNPVVRQMALQAPATAGQPPAVTPLEVDARRSSSVPLVLDADSSQVAAISSALAGRSFVLQGPPGTGKSQTITNLIGAALAEGRTVLFVSEKLAALQVVARRLEEAKLGPFCLELHSKKTNKKDVLESFRRVVDRGRRPSLSPWAEACAHRDASRDALNAHVDALHRPRPLGFSLYAAQERVAQLGEGPRVAVPLPGGASTPRAQLDALAAPVGAFAALARRVGAPGQHPLAQWVPVEWSAQLEASRGELLRSASGALAAVDVAAQRLASLLGVPAPASTLLPALCALGTAEGRGPVPLSAFGSQWAVASSAGVELLAAMAAHAVRREKLLARWAPAVLEVNLAPLAAGFVPWSDARQRLTAAVARACGLLKLSPPLHPPGPAACTALVALGREEAAGTVPGAAYTSAWSSVEVSGRALATALHDRSRRVDRLLQRWRPGVISGPLERWRAAFARWDAAQRAEQETSSELAAALGLPVAPDREALRAQVAVAEAEAAGEVPSSAYSAQWAEAEASARDFPRVLRTHATRRGALLARWAPSLFEQALQPLVQKFERWAGSSLVVAWLRLGWARWSLRAHAVGRLSGFRELAVDLREALSLGEELPSLTQRAEGIQRALGAGWSPPAGPDGLDAALARGGRASEAWSELRKLEAFPPRPEVRGPREELPRLVSAVRSAAAEHDAARAEVKEVRVELAALCSGAVSTTEQLVADLDEALAIRDQAERAARAAQQLAGMLQGGWSGLEEGVTSLERTLARGRAAHDGWMGGWQGAGVPRITPAGRPLLASALDEVVAAQQALSLAEQHALVYREQLAAWARPLPPGNAELLEDLAEAASLQEERRDLERRAAATEKSLGGGWKVDVSDLDGLRGALGRGQEAAAAWAQLGQGPGVPASPTVDEAVRSELVPAAKALQSATEAFAPLEASLALQLALRAGSAPWPSPASVEHRSQMLRVLRSWEAAVRAGFRDWCLAHAAAASVRGRGLEALVRGWESGAVAGEQLEATFERSFLCAWLDAVYADERGRALLDAGEHAEKVERFAARDAGLVALARLEVVRALEARLPREGSAGSEMATLKHELGKRSRHLPVRKLLSAIPGVWPRLKPCLLMSPLSVAQYLPPDSAPFDLVVFDEASQIGTHDAVGAMARGRQVVIVGDSKQLPPTTFFQRGTEGETPPAEDDVVDLESVLGEALACELPQQMLQWHYRSRHDALIAFSNRHFYDDQLQVFPAAQRAARGLGLQWHPVPDGAYQPGARVNRREATVLVAHLLESLRATRPGERTFGVVTFAASQQQLVQELLDEERGKDPSLEPHFRGSEAVFVKNLENVQGDERDEILFSVGYAPDAAGKLRMHFGPLSASGGERRLNVAITRARRQLRVFSTLKAEQVDLRRSRAKGAQLLKAFLEFVERQGSTSWKPESEPADALARDIAEALRARGHEVHAEVGAGSYRVALAVVHPDRPGEYALGIELDGAHYVSAPTARDRDRLRREVLEGLGWRLHRVSTPAWVSGREVQLETLLREVKAAFAAAPRSEAPVAPVPVELPAEEVSWAEEAPLEQEEVEPRVRPYVAAALPRRRGGAEQLMVDPEVRDQLLAVVEAEAPIHEDLLFRRVADAWGVERVGTRIRSRLVSQLAVLLRQEKVVRRGKFAWRVDPSEGQWVLRGPAEDGTSRELGHVAPEELDRAMVHVLERDLSLEEEALLRETAGVFNVRRLGAKLLPLLEAALARLVERGEVERVGERVRLKGR
jgi:hypothetical protein